MTIDNGGRGGTNTPVPVLTSYYDLTITGGAQVVLGGQTTSVPLGTLLITSNSWLICTNLSATLLNVSNNATIQAGGGILLDGYGYGGGAGTGAGHVATTNGILTGSGGGYGGMGGPSLAGAPGGISYGSFSEPTLPGSGGGNTTGTSPYNLGGAGGGALELTVTGTLALDGRISANGLTAVGVASGGGSGGSLWVRTGKLTGKGSFSANGGAGDFPYGGGGGGGRIFLQPTGTQVTNPFSGVFSARGGAGAIAGAAGTIYIVPYHLNTA